MPGGLFRADPALGHSGRGLRDAANLPGGRRDFGDLGSPAETVFGGAHAVVEDRTGGGGSLGSLFSGSSFFFMGSDRMVRATAACLPSAAGPDAVPNAGRVGAAAVSAPSPARIPWLPSFDTVD